MTETSPTDQRTREILQLAHEVHRLLGAGWPEAVYRDALMILCEERLISCRRAAGIRGTGPVRATIVCHGSILVRVCRGLVEESGLRHGLVAAGLERALLLRFDDQHVVSEVVRVDVPVHTMMASPSRPAL